MGVVFELLHCELMTLVVANALMHERPRVLCSQTDRRPTCLLITPQDPPPINFDEWKKETDPKLVEMFQKAYSGA